MGFAAAVQQTKIMPFAIFFFNNNGLGEKNAIFANL
jgi:hypothetical protein